MDCVILYYYYGGVQNAFVLNEVSTLGFID